MRHAIVKQRNSRAVVVGVEQVEQRYLLSAVPLPNTWATVAPLPNALARPAAGTPRSGGPGPANAPSAAVSTPASSPIAQGPQVQVGAVTRQINLAGITSFTPTVMGVPANPTGRELAPTVGNEDTPGGGAIASEDPNGSQVPGAAVAKSNPELVTSFDGLNAFQQRFANGGNQLDGEPPDQGLAVGNGYVLEVVNEVLRVYDTSGKARSDVQDLNTFFGYPAAINRTSGVRGPFITDPSAYFDTDTQRWFVDVLTLEVSATGKFLGPNHIDIAVSQTADPTGAWYIYRLPVQDDGTQGTPLHSPGAPFFGDFPHIGADKYGFYITTNEYALSSVTGGPEDEVYHAAQIYALSKNSLASGAPSVAVTQFDTIGMVHSSRLGIQPGFTVWPAISPGSQCADNQGGTEYFLSSNAAEEVNNHPPVGQGSFVLSTDLIVWALTNTQSLNCASPTLSLSNSVLTVNPYSVPPKSEQKAGDFPLGQAINDTTTSTPYGPGAWRYFGFTSEPAHNEVESHLDSSDTEMQQVVYVNGKLWGALDTAVTVNGKVQAGIAWYILNPHAGGSGRITDQGYLALANNNLTYPAIAVTPRGRGVMAFTVAGSEYFPSAGYASIDAKSGVGDIHIAALGQGPEDGDTGYKFYNPLGYARWGDYGAAVADGKSIWVASEYIGNTGTLAQYLADPPLSFTLGGTRSPLANWDTRITELSV